MNDLIKQKESISSVALDYTRNRDLFDRVNKRLREQGYDAIEDINDTLTNQPLIVLDSKTALKKTGSESGVDYAIKTLKNDLERAKAENDSENVKYIENQINEVKEFYKKR